MIIYIIKRVLWLIPIILCVTFIIFALLELAPGNVVDTMISDQMTEEDIAQLKEQYDLDKSVLYRYGKYILNLLQGDLGRSLATGRPVWNEFSSRFPKTLQLALTSLIIGVALAVPLGIFAAKRAGTIWDNLTSLFSLFALSMPGFWLGILLIIWFSYNLGLFPIQYDGTIRSYILPAVCTGLMLMAPTTRQTRSSMLENIRADYLRTARAKGVPERQVTTKHALRNAWIPIITTIGNSVARTLAGSAVIETVFGWPGIGALTVNAVSRRDVTLACGCVVMTCIVYVLLLLLVDLLYAFVDPRVKTMYASGARKKRRRLNA